MDLNNIKLTLKNNLCTGCGACEDVCAKNCIKIILKNSEYVPSIDESDCTNCGICMKVCPGFGVELIEKSHALFPNCKADKYAGRVLEQYTGYSNEYKIRFHSASGGSLSQFLIYLLKENIISGAVVTGYSEVDHLTPKPFIARTCDDILNARSSKYCPVSLNGIGNEIKNTPGRYVIVGLPCHIQAFRNRSEFDKKFRENVIGYFAIYCSSNRTFKARDFIFKRYGVNKSEVKQFAYRNNGCMGFMTVNDTEKRILELPFVPYYGALGSFFKPYRCQMCIDHYGELADISFGDIHIKPYSEDKIGVNSMIVRDSYWNTILQQANKDGLLSLDFVDIRTINESQKEMLYSKKSKAKALMNIQQLRGYLIPNYGKSMFDQKTTLKDYVSILVLQTQRFVGRHIFLWGLISFIFDKKFKRLKDK